MKAPFDTKTLQPRTLLACGAVLTHFPLRHPGGSVGYRIDWPDRSLAYVTDTVAAADADYVEKIRGVDLLIHECNFGDDQPEQARTHRPQLRYACRRSRGFRRSGTPGDGTPQLTPRKRRGSNPRFCPSRLFEYRNRLRPHGVGILTRGKEVSMGVDFCVSRPLLATKRAEFSRSGETPKSVERNPAGSPLDPLSRIVYISIYSVLGAFGHLPVAPRCAPLRRCRSLLIFARSMEPMYVG